MDFQKDTDGCLQRTTKMDKNGYKEIVAQQMAEISELKERIKELETELYFVTRNNKIEELVDEKQGNLFHNDKQTNLFENNCK